MSIFRRTLAGLIISALGLAGLLISTPPASAATPDVRAYTKCVKTLTDQARANSRELPKTQRDLYLADELPRVVAACKAEYLGGPVVVQRYSVEKSVTGSGTTTLYCRDNDLVRETHVDPESARTISELVNDGHGYRFGYNGPATLYIVCSPA